MHLTLVTTKIFATAALLFTVLVASAAVSAVELHSLFTSGAVLQQGTNLPIWGTANDGEKVTVTFQDQEVSTKARDGRWMVRLEPLSPGGPFTMTISGENTITLDNILVGEVWICSGQSNMQFFLMHDANAEQAVAASRDPQLRLFSVPYNPADAPETDVDGKWQECGSEAAREFSAVAYYFGRDLRKALNVPVGLINSSYGGTRIQAWTSSSAIAPEDAERDTEKAWDDNKQNRSSALYNGMIAPIRPFAIRGVISYQGESNADQAFRYRTLLPNMIRDWRRKWGQGDFPFVFVQLAPFGKILDEPADSPWAELREAQLLTSLNCPNTAMIVITDHGDPDDIHPGRKAPVGGRLALAARALAYGEDIVCSGPAYDSMQVKGSRAMLCFKHADGGLVARGGELTGFTVAGADKRFNNARATVQRDKVVVSSPMVDVPVAVRYGWADCPVVNLFNGEGLPASPFRTDDFPMVTAPQ